MMEGICVLALFVSCANLRRQGKGKQFLRQSFPLLSSTMTFKRMAIKTSSYHQSALLAMEKGIAQVVSATHSPAAIKSILNLLMFDETAVELDDIADEPVNDDNDLVDLLPFAVPLPARLCVRLCRLRSQLRRKTLPQEQ